MTQPAKKATDTQTAAKSVATDSGTLRPSRKPRADENFESFNSAASVYNRLTREFPDICAIGVAAAVKSGSAVFQVFQNINDEITKNSNRSLSNCTELARESLGCRTISDVISLQNKTMQQTLDYCFDEANTLCEMLFDSYRGVLEPLGESTVSTSGKIGNALAA